MFLENASDQNVLRSKQEISVELGLSDFAVVQNTRWYLGERWTEKERQNTDTTTSYHRGIQYTPAVR